MYIAWWRSASFPILLHKLLQQQSTPPSNDHLIRWCLAASVWCVLPPQPSSEIHTCSVVIIWWSPRCFISTRRYRRRRLDFFKWNLSECVAMFRGLHVRLTLATWASILASNGSAVALADAVRVICRAIAHAENNLTWCPVNPILYPSIQISQNLIRLRDLEMCPKWLYVWSSGGAACTLAWKCPRDSMLSRFSGVCRGQKSNRTLEKDVFWPKDAVWSTQVNVFVESRSQQIKFRGC